MDSVTQNRIDAYLRDEMTPRERAEFELDVQRDNDLAEQLALMTCVQQSLGERLRKTEKMQDWDQEEAAARRRGRRWLYAALSAAVCLLVVYLGVRPLEFGDRYVYDAAFFQHEHVYRGASACLRIDSLILSREYAEATSAIDSLEQICNEDLAQVDWEKETDEEILYNGQVAQELLYQLEWQRLHVLLAQGDVDQALPLLKEFKSQKGEFQQKAQELWEMLKE